MPVSGVSNSTSAATSLSSVANKTLDKNAFLKLLVTQMQNQDPMSPMEDKEFVSQLAQFSSLEQMQELNSGVDTFGKSTMANQAFAMVGKWVDYADMESGLTLTGKVGGVTFENGQPKLSVGSSSIDLGNVTRVYPDAEALGKGKVTGAAFAMIGKTVNYLDSATGTTMSGKVDNVTFADGWPMLNMGTKVVDARDAVGTYAGAASNTTTDAITQAYAMTGRTITYKNAAGQPVDGKVSNVSVDKGIPWLIIDKTMVGLGDVVKVS